MRKLFSNAQPFIVALTVLSLLFFCRGGALGMSVMAGDASHEMMGHAMEMASGQTLMSSHAMPCCDLGALPMQAHDVMIALIVFLPQLLTLFISQLWPVLYLLRGVFRRAAPPWSLRADWISRLHTLFQQLFSQGLLHPKTW